MEAAVPVNVPDALVGFDFRIVKPSQSQKLSIIERILTKQESAASIAKRCYISRKYLNSLVYNRRQGMSMNSCRGRPRLLDTESRQSICSSIVNFHCESIPQLKIAIDIEAKATFGRRYATFTTPRENDEIESSVSRRSLKRYIFLLHPG